ncbi:hypothetical protein [Paenibacillus sp. FSL K6-2859]|uniref:hypothetical protein n=1 Tax=Paenibacillus sp. FSL K6-2859 TaxID=2921482 RepID=UPI0030F9E0C3
MVVNAAKIDPHNYVVKGGAAAIPLPGAQSASILDALVKAVGKTAALSMEKAISDVTPQIRNSRQYIIG